MIINDMKRGQAEVLTSRRWARFALAFGAAASVTGNVAHTVLTPSVVGLVLRVVLAVFWPLALFVGIEVLVRVAWRDKFIDLAGRAVMMVPVSVVAAVVSYQHLHGLMRLGGEDAFSAMIGPLAIDGLMMGGTVALLAIRARALAHSIELAETALTPAPSSSTTVEDVVDTPEEALREWSASVPVSPAPPSVALLLPSNAPRRVRGQVDPRQSEAVRLILDGVERAEVIARTEVSPATEGRLRKVYRTLRDNPNADLDARAEKVRPELIDIIRATTRQEATR